MTENPLSYRIINAAYKVHTQLGPGLLESAYEFALCHELRKSGLSVERQKALPMYYDGIRLNVGFRTDLIVEGLVIIEIKSVEMLAGVHYKQLLTYLKLSGLKLGLLINFNQALLKTGISRVVNNL